MSYTDKYGPEDVEDGDKVTFTYGPGDRKHRSTKTVEEVREYNVRVDGGGLVSYRDILEIDPMNTEDGQ